MCYAATMETNPPEAAEVGKTESQTYIHFCELELFFERLQLGRRSFRQALLYHLGSGAILVVELPVGRLHRRTLLQRPLQCFVLCGLALAVGVQQLVLQGGCGGQRSGRGRDRSGFVGRVVRLGLCILCIVVVIVAGNAAAGFGGVGVREKALATFVKMRKIVQN